MKFIKSLISLTVLLQLSLALYLPIEFDKISFKLIDEAKSSLLALTQDNVLHNYGCQQQQQQQQKHHGQQQQQQQQQQQDVGDKVDYNSVINKFSIYQPLITKSGYSTKALNTEGGLKTKTSIPRNNFEEWLSIQNNIAFESILRNIGGNSLDDSYIDPSDNVSPGAVIASPSKAHPNYFYQWVRDAAITINSLIEYLDDHEFDDSKYNLKYLIESYIANNYKLQRVNNPSGKFDDLSGLGEPKFMVNSTAFKENWGRPQRDGPGLRVISIINYLNILKKYDQQLDNVEELHDFEYVYENIIKPDLKYVIRYWNANGFDLWEEINSMHLFTSLTQLKAVKLGLQFAKSIGDTDSEFIKSLKDCFIALKYYTVVDSGYRNPSLPYLVETPSLLASNKRSGLDIATILASLRSHDIDDVDDTNELPFNIDDVSVLNTLNALINDMKYRYPINHGKLGFGTGFALGRYPEDIYDGYGTSEGNPWFISTATASELLYKLIYKLYKFNEDLVIPIEQKQFYQSFIEGLELSDDITIVPFGSESFKELTTSIISYADSFLDIIREHVDNEGHISEQFNRYSGYMEGARDLTWSYGSFWSSLRWRQKVIDLIN